MRSRKIACLCAVAALAVGVSSAKDTPDQKRDKTRKMASAVLNELYKLQPGSREAIQKSAGYAVFDNMGTNLLLLSTARGSGVAVNSKTKQETFMKMVELQAGLGMGVKKFRVIFVFDNQKALNSFVNSGWEFGGQTTAAAKTGDKGGSMSGAASVSDGVWMYQLTDKGLAAEITAKSTKYYKDDDLN